MLKDIEIKLFLISLIKINVKLNLVSLLKPKVLLRTKLDLITNQGLKTS